MLSQDEKQGKISSQGGEKKPRFILGGTHLGHVLDIPPRTLQALREADLLIFEEAKPARQVLKAAGIHRSFLLFSEHHQEETLGAMRGALKNAETVIYLSDQGMPGFADPGSTLVAIAYTLGVEVEVIPGPSSLTAAIAACPFPILQFVYQGFLPQKQEERVRLLTKLKDEKRTQIFLDAPYRRDGLLRDMHDIFGKDRMALLAIDISGPGERYLFGNLRNIVKWTESIEKCNFVFILQGSE